MKKKKNTKNNLKSGRRILSVEERKEMSKPKSPAAETPEIKEPIKPPNVFKMMKSFGKDLSKYVLAGAPNCSKEDYKERLLTCDACPHLMRNVMRCGKCGCLVEHKAKWRTTTCPINKWKKQDVSDIKAKQEEAKKKQEEEEKKSDSGKK
tara:strand:+ start:867 stop:1316 length:450 start_codon:yes stop_codon:yes gene_type:complete